MSVGGRADPQQEHEEDNQGNEGQISLDTSALALAFRRYATKSLHRQPASEVARAKNETDSTRVGPDNREEEL